MIYRFGSKILDIFITLPIRRRVTRFANWIEWFFMNSSKEGYSDPNLAQEIARKNLEFQKNLEFDNLDLESYRVLTAMGIAISQSTQSQQAISVIDFGGGAGRHFFIADKIFPLKIEKYLIIETPEMVKSCSSLTNEKIRFDSSVNQATTEWHLLFSSGALHYTQNPIQSLRDLLSLRPKFVYFTKTLFSTDANQKKKREFSRLSGNGASIMGTSGINKINNGSKLVSYTTNCITKSAFEQIMSEKYKKIFEVDEGIPNGYFSTDGIRMFGLCYELI